MQAGRSGYEKIFELTGGPKDPQTWLAQQPMQQASHTMRPYQPGVNIPMARTANMSSLTSPRPQTSVCDEMGQVSVTREQEMRATARSARTTYK